MKALLLAIVILLAGCANLRESTHLATAADATTTAIGVTSGLAVEANPLISSPAVFAGVMLTRIVATEYVNSLPEPGRTTYLSAMSSIWWGAGISNVMILLLASNPIGLAFGAMTGLGWWASTEQQRTFAEICARERIERPALVCTYTPT